MAAFFPRRGARSRARTFLLVTLVWVVGSASALADVGGDGGTTRPPNILLISIDSLRSDHVSSYGYGRETTPVLDSLAREGVRFSTVVSSSSWTLPAHMTLFTAKPPEQHGVTSTFKQLEPKTVTLARILHEAGYDTAAFVAAPYLRSFYGYANGFDVYDESIVSKGHFESLVGLSSPTMVQKVTDYLDRWAEGGRSKPFFVFLHLWDVHFDYTPPPPYDTMFDPDYEGDITGVDFIRNPKVRPDMDRRDLEHLIALYDGEIRFTDEQVGRVLAVLDRLELRDDTIVAVTSDHGEEFFEHGRKGHGSTLYEEAILVPWLVRYPQRVPGGQVESSPVRLMDIAPTILGLAGVPSPKAFGTGELPVNGSRDLSPWLRAGGSKDPFPTLLAWSHTGKKENEQRATRSATGKYIVYANEKRKGTEFFDLTTDPGEKTDLAGVREPSAQLRELEREGARWAEIWEERVDTAHTIEIDDQHRRNLFLLGYLDAADEPTSEATPEPPRPDDSATP